MPTPSIGHMIITVEDTEIIMATIMVADITIVMIIVLQLHILQDTTIQRSPRTTLVQLIIMATPVMTIPVLIILAHTIPVRMMRAITVIMVITVQMLAMVIRIVQHQ